MSIPYTPPTHGKNGFNCPHCHAYAKQEFHDLVVDGYNRQPKGISVCARCGSFALWVENRLVYPSASTAPPANPDLPDDVVQDYDEARDILNRSPRGAAALLRLAIQKLCIHVGEAGQNLNQDIKALGKRGLLPQVQQALDVVRVIGNNAVHPGQIDVSDQPETATALFALVNLIAQQLISDPKQAQALFDSLPQAQREAVAKRDQQPT